MSCNISYVSYLETLNSHIQRSKLQDPMIHDPGFRWAWRLREALHREACTAQVEAREDSQAACGVPKTIEIDLTIRNHRSSLFIIFYHFYILYIPRHFLQILGYSTFVCPMPFLNLILRVKSRTIHLTIMNTCIQCFYRFRHYIVYIPRHFLQILGYSTSCFRNPFNKWFFEYQNHKFHITCSKTCIRLVFNVFT